MPFDVVVFVFSADVITMYIRLYTYVICNPRPWAARSIWMKTVTSDWSFYWRTWTLMRLMLPNSPCKHSVPNRLLMFSKSITTVFILLLPEQTVYSPAHFLQCSNMSLIQWNPHNSYIDYSYFRLIRTNLPTPGVDFLYFSLSIIGNTDITYQTVCSSTITIIRILLYCIRISASCLVWRG